MNKNLLIALGVLVVILAGAYFYKNMNAPTTPPVPYPQPAMTSTPPATSQTSTADTTGVGAGQHCGGNMMNAPVCATGYRCAPEPGSHLPFGDVGGICVAVSGSAGY
jgi:hypothetical protein